MSCIACDNNLGEPIQTNNIVKVKVNKEQESIEIDQKQAFTEIEKDFDIIIGSFLGTLFGLLLWFLIVSLIA